MVAYSFQSRFEPAIISRRKIGTIRAVGKRRHARPGEQLQLYTGMRTRSCRLIGRATCEGVLTISLCFATPLVWLGHHIHGAPIGDLDKFARGDGFKDWDELVKFWADNHPGKRLWPWTGLWILWDPAELAL